MRADGRALFHDDNRDVWVQHFESDRRGQTRGPRADDHNVVVHRFPRGQCRIVGHDAFRRQSRVAQLWVQSSRLDRCAILRAAPLTAKMRV